MSKASMPELLRLFAAKAEEWCNATDTEDAWRIECEAVEAFREAFATAAQEQAEPGADERAAFDENWAAGVLGLGGVLSHDAKQKVALVLLGARAAQSGQRAGVADDTARLDWLDEQNRKKNASHGTMYGWGYSVNCNRIALEDHHWPARTVREALDAAMLAAPTQQPSTDQS